MAADRQHENICADSSIRGEDFAMAKLFETIRAECALAGVTLVASRDERDRAKYIVSRRALTRELSSLDSVRAWLRTVTGGQCGN